jgi:hypothetical protein
MNIYDIVAESNIKKIVTDKEFLEFHLNESKKLKPVKIVDGVVHWNTSLPLNEAPGDRISFPGNKVAVLEKIPGANGWFGVAYNNGEVGTFDNREDAVKARDEYRTAARDARGTNNPIAADPDRLGSTNDNSDVEAYKRTREATLRSRLRNSAGRARIKRLVNSTNNMLTRALKRFILVPLGVWLILEEFLIDLWNLSEEILEMPMQEQMTTGKQMAIDFIKIEGSRVFGQLLGFFAAALLVARTARLLVSGLLNLLRTGSLATGPVGAAIVISITLIAEGVLWFVVTTDWFQEKMRSAFLWALQNIFPSIVNTAFRDAGEELADGDGFTEGFLRDTEQAARDMVDMFGETTAQEMEELRDKVEAERSDVERNDDPNAAPQDRTAPAAPPTRSGPVATPSQSISQQLGTLEW